MRNNKGQFVKGARSEHYRHGGYKKWGVFYAKFKGIKRRCNNTHEMSYPLYGGRGIKCEWNLFEDFKKDMYESYLKHLKKYGQKDTTIERIDSNGNYCKDNCRWATRQEQCLNRRSNVKITYKGIAKSITEWSKELNINYGLLKARIDLDWDFERAITVPSRKLKYQNPNNPPVERLLNQNSTY